MRQRLPPVLIAAVAVAAALWAATMIPQFAASHSIDGHVRRIAQGQSYRLQNLLAMKSNLDATSPPADACWENHLFSNLMIDLSLVDRASVDVAAGDIDARYEAAAQAAKALLRCAPRTAIAWLALYWVEVRNSGLTPRAIELLRAAYSFAPREAWISIRRARSLLPIVDFLPEDMRPQVIGEFRRLVAVGLFDDMAAAIRTVAPERQRKLLESLRDLSMNTRQSFVRALGSNQSAVLDILGLPNKAELRPYF